MRQYAKGNFKIHLNLRNPIMIGVVAKISIMNNPIDKRDRKESRQTSLNPIP